MYYALTCIDIDFSRVLSLPVKVQTIYSIFKNTIDLFGWIYEFNLTTQQK